eukprot:scaffold13584_cov92-Isochrysis_galbana.AAC.2
MDCSQSEGEGEEEGGREDDDDEEGRGGEEEGGGEEEMSDGEPEEGEEDDGEVEGDVGLWESGSATAAVRTAGTSILTTIRAMWQRRCTRRKRPTRRTTLMSRWLERGSSLRRRGGV